MSTSEKIQELITYSRVLYERKLLHATGGNTSIRVGEVILISQTGAELGSLSEAEVVKVDLQGNVLEGVAPSKEIEQCCQISVASGMKGEWLTDAQCQEIDQAVGRTWKV